MSFDSTDWTQLVIARDWGASSGKEAFERLLTRYRPAMVQFVTTKYRLHPNDAEEIVQQFIVDRMIEQNLFAKADRARGKFRGFLATVLHHYIIDKLRAKKIQAPDATASAHIDTIAQEVPVDHFDRAWAESVLAEALAATEYDLVEGGKETYWKLFHNRVVEAAYSGREIRPYEEVVLELGFESPRAASNALVTAKRSFTRCLLRAVGATGDEDPQLLVNEVLEILRHRAT